MTISQVVTLCGFHPFLPSGGGRGGERERERVGQLRSLLGDLQAQELDWPKKKGFFSTLFTRHTAQLNSEGKKSKADRLDYCDQRSAGGFKKLHANPHCGVNSSPNTPLHFDFVDKCGQE